MGKQHPWRPHRWVVAAAVHPPGGAVTRAQEWCTRGGCQAERVRDHRGVRTLAELRDRGSTANWRRWQEIAFYAVCLLAILGPVVLIGVSG